MREVIGRVYKCGLLVLAMVIFCTACGKSAATWQDQYDLGMQYLTEGDYEQAVVAFTAAIEIEPNDIRAYTGLVQVYVESDDYESAVTVVDTAIDVLKEAEKSTEQENLDSFVYAAIDSYETVGDMDRQYDFWVSLSEICAEDEADSYLQKGSVVLAQMGTEYRKQGDYEAAIDAFTKALDLAPENVDLYVERGDTYLLFEESDGNIDMALADYEMAVTHENIYVDAYLRIADIYFQRNDIEKAEEYLETWMEVIMKEGTESVYIDSLQGIETTTVTDSTGAMKYTWKKWYSNYTGEVWGYHVIINDSEGNQSIVLSYDADENLTGYVEVNISSDDYSEDWYVGYESNFSEWVVRNSIYSEMLYQECYGYMNYYGNQKPADNLAVYKVILEYDEEERLIKQTEYKPLSDEINYIARFEYTSDGNEIRYEYDGDDNLLGYIYYYYNSDGINSEVEGYDENGNLIYHYYTIK